MFDPVEKALRDVLKGEHHALPSQTGKCPAPADLWAYLNGQLPDEKEGAISGHLMVCAFCLDALLLAQEVRPGIGFGPETHPSERALSRAISLGKRKGRYPPKPLRSVWAGLFLLSIGFSFLLPRYFLQCLVLGTIFGLKWVFDTVTNRTLIVMYDTLKRRESPKERVRDPEETSKRFE